MKNLYHRVNFLGDELEKSKKENSKLSKDLSVAIKENEKLVKELGLEKKRNLEFEKDTLKERVDLEKLIDSLHEKFCTKVKAEETLSFKIGALMIKSAKSFGGIFSLPYNLLKLNIDHKNKLENKVNIPKEFEKSTLLNVGKWKLLEKKCESKTELVGSNNFLEIRLFSYFTNESAKKAAVVLINFYDINDNIVKDIKIKGLAWSKSFNSLFFYLKINQTDPKQFSCSIPENVHRVEVHLEPFVKEAENLVFYRDFDFRLHEVGLKKRFEISNEIIEGEAKLKEIEVLDFDIMRYKISHFLLNAPSYLKAKYLRKIVDNGDIELASNLYNSIEIKDRLTFKDNMSAAQGYIGLSKRPYNITNDKLFSAYDPSGPICFVCYTNIQYHDNGYAIRTHSVLKELQKNKKVIVLTRPGYPKDVLNKGEYTISFIDNVEYRTLGNAHYYKDPLNDYLNKSEDILISEISEIRPSIVIGCSNFVGSLPALNAARKLMIPFVYEVRGFWEITRASTKAGWGDSLRFELEKKHETIIARNADRVIALNSSIKDELISRGVVSDKITIIPNGVNQEKFNKIQQVDLKINEGHFTFGYFGALANYEGIDDLLYALSDLKKNGNLFNFILAGDGPFKDEILELINTLSLGDCVYYLGRRSVAEIGYLYSKINCFVMPRKSMEVSEKIEPIKPFEAMLMKKPIIASDVAAVKAFINKVNANGILFKKGSRKDLKAKLLFVLKNKNESIKIGNSAYNWLLQNRLFSSLSIKYFELIDGLSKESGNFNDSKQRKKSPQVAKILIYADVDINLLDGSSIWLSSISETLAHGDNIHIDVLLKKDDLESKIVLPLLDLNSNISVIRPSSHNFDCALSPSNAINLIKELHDSNDYDAIIVRGKKIIYEAVNDPNLIGLLWVYPVDILQSEVVSDIDIKALKQAKKVISQSHFFKEKLVHNYYIEEDKIIDMPPMVPMIKNDGDLFKYKKENFRCVYAGKFDPIWGTLEMMDIFESINNASEFKLTVYGNKFHSTDLNFKNSVIDKFSNKYVDWKKDIPRQEILEDYKNYSIGWAWRPGNFEDNTTEISTKFVEYSSRGLPSVLKPSKVYIDLLGEDYPLFFKDAEEIKRGLLNVVNNPELMNLASDRVLEVSKNFSYQHVFENNFKHHLNFHYSNKKFLFAGHDLKFITQYILYLRNKNYKVFTDIWKSHQVHDKHKSKSKLLKSNYIFTEWMLGNAEWYSYNKLPHQKLVARFHLQELDTVYPGNSMLENFNKIIFIAPHVMRKAQNKFWPKAKNITLIENYTETGYLNNQNDSRIFTLGFVGIVPMRKRIDKALDLLERLREHDDRYTLRIKGKLPKDFPWMQNRKDELSYYEKQFYRIENSEKLKGAVFFDQFGHDMGKWYSQCGYMLSVSDFEGCHLSIGESMSYGCIPIISNWDGADEIYPNDYIFKGINQCEEFITHLNDSKFNEYQKKCFEYSKKWEINKISKHLTQLFDS